MRTSGGLSVAITRARDHLYLSTHQRVTSQSAAPSPYFTLAAGPSAPLVTAAPWTPTQLPAHPHGAGDKPTFSFSELAQYQSCPLQYRFRQNLGFQPQAAKELGYGRAVHHVLRRLAEHVRQHGDVPSLLGFEQLFDREFYLPYADRSAWETMEARARTVVTHYLTHFRADLDRVWEVERSFELHLDSANVVGRADVILDREDGLPGGLALVDYKTRSVAKVDEAMALQLQVYTAAARGEGYDVRAAWLHDLTAPKAAARVTVASTPDVVLIATQALTALARGVRDRSFPAQPGDGCRYCDVRPLCRHARTQ
ncbi:MAG: PD-(D/E)XK nuclease family protein [Deltaproteobacteria bacterium]|nr:PD-(D/E)XK nuclease family protein [Deltaproteobacteria bacterium]